jgi:hypothetical protein
LFDEFQLTESFLTGHTYLENTIVFLAQKHNEEYYFYGRIPQNSEEVPKTFLAVCVLLKVNHFHFQTLHFRTKDH